RGPAASQGAVCSGEIAMNTSAPTNPRVSVVMPTHDRADTVARAVQSVLVQTFQDLELIVVDDGSTDNTSAVLAALADPRLRVLRLDDNCGVSHARNIGVGAARGELLAFLDSDDEWLPEKLAAQVACHDATTSPSLVYCRHWRQDARTGRRAPPARPLKGNPFEALLQGWDPLPS